MAFLRNSMKVLKNNFFKSISALKDDNPLYTKFLNLKNQYSTQSVV